MKSMFMIAGIEKKVKINLFLSVFIFATFVISACAHMPPDDFIAFQETELEINQTREILLDMVWVEGGSFERGRALGTAGSGDINPVHTITLSGFYISRDLVTQAQFEAIMGINPSWFTTSPDGNPSNLPVEGVNWYHAIVFSNRLSIMLGLMPAYEIEHHLQPGIWTSNPDDWGAIPTSSNGRWNAVRIVADSTGYRLPTEAQWEFAAKGGNTRPNDFFFSGSNNANDVAWLLENSGGRTHEVRRLAPNGLGIYDLSGNVYEWVWDWLGGYSSEPMHDPLGVSSGSVRVMRGGGFRSPASGAGIVGRGHSNPADTWPSGGFRLVRL